jgi:microcystin-dependent protein
MFSLKFREQLMQTPGVAEEFDALYKRLNAFLQVAFNDDGTLIQEPAAQISELGLAVGSIVAYGGTSVPTGWLLCDGTAISRATYRTLFDAISTAFGTGDGSTTFNVPDLRGRFPLGKAAAGTGSTLGGTGGAIDHTHTGPSHQHAVTGGPTVGTPSATTEVQSGLGATVASSTHTHALSGSVDAAGAGNTGTANPPFQAVNYIILAQ